MVFRKKVRSAEFSKLSQEQLDQMFKILSGKQIPIPLSLTKWIFPGFRPSMSKLTFLKRRDRIDTMYIT